MRSTEVFVFDAAGNMSILPFYFSESSPSLRLDDSLDVALRLTSFGTTWEFTISGNAIILHGQVKTRPFHIYGRCAVLTTDNDEDNSKCSMQPNILNVYNCLWQDLFLNRWLTINSWSGSEIKRSFSCN